MNELFKSAVGGRRAYVIILGWLGPIVVGFFAFAIVILPEIKSSAFIARLRTVAGDLGVNRFVFAFAMMLTVASLGFLCRVTLYRLLEGETWPRWLRNWRIRRAHLPHWRYLQAKQQHDRAMQWLLLARTELEAVQHIRTPEEPRLAENVRRAELDENRWAQREEELDTQRQHRGRKHKYIGPLLDWVPRRRRPLGVPRDARTEDSAPTYPSDQDDIRPTRFGNAMRAMETYGAWAYGLDSQTLWYELYSEASEPLRSAVDDAELQTDTFVCGIYVAWTFAGAAFASALWCQFTGRASGGIWVAGVTGLALIPVVHRGLLRAVDEWRATVQALVTNGRRSLREKYGLVVPENKEQERAMWQALTGYVYYGGDEYYSTLLDRYREPATKP